MDTNKKFTCFVLFEKRLRAVYKATKILKQNSIKFLVVNDDKKSKLKTLFIYCKPLDEVKTILDTKNISYQNMFLAGKGVHHKKYNII